MELGMIRPKAGLCLRKIGRQYMIVDVSDENVNLCKVYSLNDTAARLWEQLENGNFTEAELTTWFGEVYDIDADTALRDVGRQLVEWRAYGLID